MPQHGFWEILCIFCQLGFGVRQHVAAFLDATCRVGPKRGRVRALQSRYAETDGSRSPQFAIRNSKLSGLLFRFSFWVGRLGEMNLSRERREGSEVRRTVVGQFETENLGDVTLGLQDFNILRHRNTALPKLSAFHLGDFHILWQMSMSQLLRPPANPKLNHEFPLMPKLNLGVYS